MGDEVKRSLERAVGLWRVMEEVNRELGPRGGDEETTEEQALMPGASGSNVVAESLPAS